MGFSCILKVKLLVYIVYYLLNNHRMICYFLTDVAEFDIAGQSLQMGFFQGNILRNHQKKHKQQLRNK